MPKQFYKWYDATIEAEVEKNYHSRQSIWSEALAVGRKEWVESFSDGLLRTKILPFATEPTGLQAFTINEPKATYGLYASHNAKRQFWKRHQESS